MAATTLFSEAHIKLMHQLYLRQHYQPADVTTALNEKFGTTFESDQVRRAIVARGWSARRKKILAKEHALSLVTDKKIETQLVTAHAKTMEKFATAAQTGADRALAMVQIPACAISTRAPLSFSRTKTALFPWGTLGTANHPTSLLPSVDARRSSPYPKAPPQIAESRLR